MRYDPRPLVLVEARLFRCVHHLEFDLPRVQALPDHVPVRRITPRSSDAEQPQTSDECKDNHPVRPDTLQRNDSPGGLVTLAKPFQSDDALAAESLRQFLPEKME